MADASIHSTQAAPQAPTTAPTVRVTPAPAAPAQTTQGAAAAPRDSSNVANRAAGSAAATVSLMEAPPRAVDFVQSLPGLRAGQNLSIDGGMFIGGNGSISQLDSDHVKMHLHITFPFGSTNLDINVQNNNGHYVMTSPEHWDLDMTKNGSTVVMTNHANHGQQIEITAKHSGELSVHTKGLGHDGTTLDVKSH